MTHTYAVMNVSFQTYEELNVKLLSAGYEHAFMEDGTLNMHGLGIATTEVESDEDAQPYVRAIILMAGAMVRKMDKKRSEDNFRGWDDPEQCSEEQLRFLLNVAVQKGDPIDVANYAMMLHHRGARTA